MEHFEEAMEMHQKMGATAWLAHTQYECARTLLRSGRGRERARAQALLQAARHSVEDLGMKPLLEAIDRLVH